MIACHQVKPKAIRELPVRYVEMFELTKIPIFISSPFPHTVVRLTIIMKSPKRPCSTTSFDRFNIIINPSRQLRLWRDLESLHESHLARSLLTSRDFDKQRGKKRSRKNFDDNLSCQEAVISVWPILVGLGCTPFLASIYRSIEIHFVKLEAYLRAVPRKHKVWRKKEVQEASCYLSRHKSPMQVRSSCSIWSNFTTPCLLRSSARVPTSKSYCSKQKKTFL